MGGYSSRLDEPVILESVILVDCVLVERCPSASQVLYSTPAQFLTLKRPNRHSISISITMFSLAHCLLERARSSGNNSWSVRDDRRITAQIEFIGEKLQAIVSISPRLDAH